MTDAAGYPRLRAWIEHHLARMDVTVTQLAQDTGLDRSGLQRWKAGALRPSIENARTLATACGRPLLELLVAAGYLTDDEADQRIVFTAAPEQLTDEQLADEVLRRMRMGTGTRPTVRHLTAAEMAAEPGRYELISPDQDHQTRDSGDSSG